MPKKNAAITINYLAYDANGGKTGDAANHTLRIIADGVEATPAASPSEVDATNLPGVYKVTISATENTGAIMLLGGKSSTSGVSIAPFQWTNESNAAQIGGTAQTGFDMSGRVQTALPNAAAGAQGGLSTHDYAAATFWLLGEMNTLRAIGDGAIDGTSMSGDYGIFGVYNSRPYWGGFQSGYDIWWNGTKWQISIEAGTPVDGKLLNDPTYVELAANGSPFTATGTGASGSIQLILYPPMHVGGFGGFDTWGVSINQVCGRDIVDPGGSVTIPRVVANDATVAKDATVSKPGTAQTITPPETMATAANQTTIINALNTNLDAKVSDAIAAAEAAAGTGANTVTITVTDEDGNAIQGASVTATLNGLRKGQATTNASGVATLNLNNGTYDVAITADGFGFSGDTLDVEGDSGDTFQMETIAITPNPDPALCNAYVHLIDRNGQPESGQMIEYRIVGAPDSTSGVSLDCTAVNSATSDSDGLVVMPLMRGYKYQFRRGSGEFTPKDSSWTVPDSGTAAIPLLLSKIA